MEGQTEQAAAVTPPPASGAPTGAEQTTPPAPAAPNGNGAAPSIAQGGEAPPPAEQKAYWPEDWREKAAQHIAAGDDKAYKRELKRLERIADPAGVYGMYRELESKFTGGGLIKKPGPDAKPEEIAEFHKALGVPEKPEDYLSNIKLENGAVIGDADKPVIGEFVGAMHQAGAPPAVVQQALNWYYKSQEAQAAQLDEADDKFRVEAERTLKEEYGPAFKRMTNAITGIFKTAPGGTDKENPNSLFNRLMAGRTADGKVIGNDPDIVRWLVSLAQDVNPAATVAEDGAESGVSIENEIAGLEKRMREDRRAYFKDEKAQARYRELITAREKIRARAR